MKKDRLTYWEKRCLVPPEVVKHFAPTRTNIKKVVDSCPKYISLHDALKQIALFRENR